MIGVIGKLPEVPAEYHAEAAAIPARNSREGGSVSRLLIFSISIGFRSAGTIRKQVKRL